MRKHKNAESAPVEYLSWATILAASPEKFREEVREQLLEELRKFSALGEGHADKTAGESLYRELSDPALWEFVGFSPSLHYIKEKAPSKDELEALWVHPWGSAAPGIQTPETPDHHHGQCGDAIQQELLGGNERKPRQNRKTQGSHRITTAVQMRERSSL